MSSKIHKLTFEQYFRFIFSSLFGTILGLITLEVLFFASGKQPQYSLIKYWTQAEHFYIALVILVVFIILGFIVGVVLNTRDTIGAWVQEVNTLKLAGEAKTDLISFAAHEIRNPLTGLNLSLNLLIKGNFGAVNEEQLKSLIKSYEEVQNMNTLVTAFLDASKIDSEKFELILRQVELEKIITGIKSTIDALDPIIKSKGITLNFQPVISVAKKYVYVDQNRLNEVVQNLLQNASNYTPSQGKIDVAIKLSGSAFQVSITDSGIGIPKKEQDKIFTKFYRAVNAIKALSGGSGLGLYLCKKIIEGHKGRVWFDSEEGSGSTFYFEIPFSTPARVEDLFRKI